MEEESLTHSTQHNFWLAIIRRTLFTPENPTSSWWCFPENALAGDKVLLYYPRSYNPNNNGILGLCEISLGPEGELTPYGCRGSLTEDGGSLLPRSISLIELFETPLTAQSMKRNKILVKSNPVRRNFQGTTFSFNSEQFHEAVEVIKKINTPEYITS